jgi:HNH endonuclease
MESIRSLEAMPFRFWDKVLVGDNCWEWQGYKDQRGYGRTRIDGKGLLTHRVAWTIWNGPIPDGALVCHHCDNPSCVRPAHLFLGTHRDNTRDMLDKDRHRWRGKNLCIHGHPLDGIRKNGQRCCKTCRSNWAKKRAKKKRAVA